GELPRDVVDIVWGPKAGQVSFVGWQKPVEILNAATFEPVRKVGTENGISFATSKDENIVAWCENTTWFSIHDLRTVKITVLDTKNPQPGVAFSPDGKLIATGGYGTEAKLWDVAKGEHVRSFSTDAEGGLTPVFSPDGKLLAVGNRN